jgi:hypothetical protein
MLVLPFLSQWDKQRGGMERFERWKINANKVFRRAARSKIATRGDTSNTSIYPALPSVEVCHR